MRFAIKVVVGLAVVAGYQNCSPEHFNQMPSSPADNSTSNVPTGGGNPPSCSTVLQNTTENLRIIFMVDNSGSTDTSDPKEVYRVKALQTFIAQYGSKTNFTYGMGMFATAAIMYDVKQKAFASSPASPFGVTADLSNALTIFETTKTQSGTGYGAAFAALQTAILSDVTAASQLNYVVVFMSDGQPTDLKSPVDTSIIGLVDGLRNTVKGKGGLVTVSSVYFGPESDSTSIDHLTTMATEGKGQFVDANKLAANSFAIDDVITVPGTVCQ